MVIDRLLGWKPSGSYSRPALLYTIPVCSVHWVPDNAMCSALQVVALLMFQQVTALLGVLGCYWTVLLAVDQLSMLLVAL